MVYQWTPLADVVGFQVFRCSDSVVNSLAQSQVALHESRTALSELLSSTNKNRIEWERQKTELVSFCLVTWVLRCCGLLLWVHINNTVPAHKHYACNQEERLRRMQVQVQESERLFKVRAGVQEGESPLVKRSLTGG
jgi:hypothetical protein